MKLNYQLARRLKRYKEEKRQLEAIEKDLSGFFQASETEKKEEVEKIETKIISSFKANKELSSTSVQDKEARNAVQRKYRENKRLKEIEAGEGNRKPGAVRFPVKVFKLRIANKD